MAHSFDEEYLRCSEYSIAIIVANRVIGDSRVLKTAASLSRCGYRVHLFGLNVIPEKKTIEGFPFRITLVPSPRKKMEGRGVELDTQGRLALRTEVWAAEYLDALDGKSYDFLHTHDMVGLPLGAKLRESGMVGMKGWIHDIHEYVEGLTYIDEESRLFHLSMEKQHITKPEALTCVSPILSRLIADTYELAPPGVVLNAPWLSGFDPFYPNPIRRALGIEENVPLLVYIGNVRPRRGLHFAVEALSFLPGVHLALITNGSGPYMKQIIDTAGHLGVKSRLHLHTYVPHNEVTSFIRGATAGIKPNINSGTNAELALPTKLFEYLHAGLPVVFTAATAISEFVNEHNCGVTHRSEDVNGFAEAVKKVLARFPEGLPDAAQGSPLAQRFCWEEQEKVIFSYYDQMMLQDRPASNLSPASEVQPILQLPKYSANQPGTLARALVKLGFESKFAALGRHPFRYASDILITREQRSVSAVKSYFCDQGLGSYRTYHFHACPLLYNVYDGEFAFPTGFDLVLLKAMGKRVFFHFRGSEIRMHSSYRLTSPYNWVDEYQKHKNIPLQRIKGLPYFFNEQDQRAFRDFVCAVCDGVFVTDPELQCYVPDALIVPRVIEIDAPDSAMTEDEGQAVPVIVHAPSRDIAKGTQSVVAAVEQLEREGYKFEFYLVQDMPHEEAMAMYRKATIVVDSLRTGWYGVLAVEGMALGKCVISYISSHLRHYLPYPSPLVSANPDNLTEVLRYLLDNPEEAAGYGKRGRDFVERYHDARAVAKVLMHLYRGPIRPINPAAVADFVAYQMGKEPKPGKYASLKPVNVALKFMRTVVSADNVGEFISVIKEEGLFTALNRSFTYVKSVRGRLRSGRHPGYPPIRKRIGKRID